jgi:hypothetical protein
LKHSAKQLTLLWDVLSFLSDKFLYKLMTSVKRPHSHQQTLHFSRPLPFARFPCQLHFTSC